jgi:hypothetical protein
MENQTPAKVALPLLALLALASALGVAVAIALAGVAMLLAAPAYADEGGLMLERGARLERAKLLFAESESEEDGYERIAFMPHAFEARHALLTRRQGPTVVEPTAEIGPGETLLVELEYRRAGPRRLLAGR